MASKILRLIPTFQGLDNSGHSEALGQAQSSLTQRCIFDPFSIVYLSY